MDILSRVREEHPELQTIIVTAYPWPGNVRELRFAVERAGLLAEGEVIEAEDLPPEIRGGGAQATRAEAASADSAMPARRADAARMRATLEQARWKREKAAEILEGSPQTLFRWMRRLGL